MRIHSTISTKLQQGCLLIASLLLWNTTLADDVVYRLDILGGTVKQTPAEINLFSPVTAELSGSFYLTISDSSIQLSDAILSSEPETGFELPASTATYDGFDFSAAANDDIFDKGFSGTFDGNTFTIKGSKDSRPVDGPLVEYEFTAAVVMDDVITITDSVPPLAQDFFMARPDLRKCASPDCGGFFVSLVNKGRTRCADGQFRAACYVAKIQATSIAAQRVEYLHKPMLLQGRVTRAKFQNRQIPVLKARMAYLPAVDTPLTESTVFVGLQNNGLVCISSPCFSYDEFKLNTERSWSISSVDLSTIKASNKQMTAFNNKMANGRLVFAAGVNRKVQEFSGTGITFVGQQFFLPIPRPATQLCVTGYEYKNGQCVTPYGCIAPELELNAYGGAPIIDPVTGEVSGTVTTSCVSTCETPAIATAPGRCEIYYP